MEISPLTSLLVQLIQDCAVYIRSIRYNSAITYSSPLGVDPLPM